MNAKRRNGPRAIAALLLFSIAQVGLQVGFAEPMNANSANNATLVPQQLAGRLTTKNNQPVTVNGLSANTGASILSGATIETGADQSATVNLGPLGSLKIQPNTKVVLTFEQGNAKALVLSGCVTLEAEKGTTGEIATEQSSHSRTDPAAGGTLNNCSPSPAVGDGRGGVFGLGLPASLVLLAVAEAAAFSPLFIFEGDDDAQSNPSPSTP
jgi:hypothetical protein